MTKFINLLLLILGLGIRPHEDNPPLPKYSVTEINRGTEELIIYEDGRVEVKDTWGTVNNINDKLAKDGITIIDVNIKKGHKYVLTQKTLIHSVCVLDNNLNHSIDKNGNIVIKTKQKLPRTNYLVTVDNVGCFTIYRIKDTP